MILFGTVQIRTEGTITSHFRSSRVPALLAYLLLHPNGDVSREELADRLWPNLHSEATRNNLRVTLQYLKKDLEAHGITNALDVSNRARIRIDRSIVGSDVDEFRAMVEAARSEGDAAALRRAVSLAKAPLLVDLYDEWIEVARADLAQDRYGCLCRLARLLLDVDPSQTVQLARKAAAENPYLDEPRDLIGQGLMRLGDPAAAMAELRLYKDSLHAIGADPSPHIERMLSEVALASASNEQGRLPHPFTRFFGRTEELQRIRLWFRDPDSRLLTLVGPGGIGKTRLAIESIGSKPEAQQAVWVPCVDVATGDRLLEQICRSLYPEADPTSGNPMPRIRLGLTTDTLLVLDNLEQLPDRELHVIRDLLQSVPSLKVLATSRKTLAIPGERIFRIAPLGASEDALALLIDRAISADPSFVPEEEVLPKLRELCSTLEYIPLAIELAAARLVSMSLEELRQAMDQRLDALVSRRATGERHAAMRATIDWSFAQLGSSSKRSLCELAVLRGTWDRSAAAAVLASEPSAVSAILEIGVEHSLLSRESTPFGVRYRMLECIRAYALETIRAGERSALELRLAQHCVAIAERLDGFPQLELDWPNISAALATLISEVSTRDMALRLTNALLPFSRTSSLARDMLALLGRLEEWPVDLQPSVAHALASFQVPLGRYGESIQMVEIVLAGSSDLDLRISATLLRAAARMALGDVEDAKLDALSALEDCGNHHDGLRFLALQSLAKAMYLTHDAETAHYANEGVLAAKRLGDPARLLDALDTLGCVQVREGNLADAEATFLEMEAIASKAGRESTCRAPSRLAHLAFVRGDYASARAEYETSLQIARQSQDHWMITQILTELGDTLQYLGEYEQARAAHSEALGMRRLTGEKLGQATSLRGLARADLALQNSSTAEKELCEAIQLGNDLAERPFLATVLIPYARLLENSGRIDEARRWVRVLFEEIGADQVPRELIDMPEFDLELRHLRSLLR